MPKKINMADQFRGKKVLITGGLGFIGSNLARKLVEFDAKITIVDSLIEEYGGNLFNIDGFKDRLRVNIADVRDPHSMAYLVRDHDYLFNLAGQTSHMDSMTDPDTDLEINCRAQLSILEACRRHNPTVKIVFAGTRQIYGKPDYLPVNEAHAIRPVDVNGINKMAGEHYHILYNNVYGIPACALRLTNTYGPRMRVKDARQTFLGVWIRRIIEGETFEVWGGDQLRDFTYVDDAVEALMLAATSDEANGRVFNLGGFRPFSLNEMADLLVEKYGGGKYQICEFPADRKQIDIGSFYSDFSSIRESLGWEPTISEAEGLAATIKFYQAHLKHYL
ncbi:MAG: NAD-dependent epimerase [Acidobacteria bacterium]|nr:MAG: NAD-dependent epimerase [Acidobacteriota bacterium]